MSCDDITESVHLDHTRGDRFALTLRLTGSTDDDVAALVEALADADIACRIANSAGSTVAECEITTEVDGDDMTIVAATDDTDWTVDAVLRFDIETVSTAMGRYTLLPGSTITVRGDVTEQEVGS